MGDNTTLSNGVGGDTIATEELASGAQRGDPRLPVTGYKIPRSKIAIGVLDQDQGDASFDQPLPAESRAARQRAELGYMQALDASAASLRSRQSERFPLSIIGARGIGDRGGR